MRKTTKMCVALMLLVLLSVTIVLLVACNESKVEKLVADFDNSHVIYEGDSIDSLKPYFKVIYTDKKGAEVQVSNYTLTGVLTVGQSEIIIAYNGLSASVWVNVVPLSNADSIVKNQQNNDKKFIAYVGQPANENLDDLNFKTSVNMDDRYYLFYFYLGEIVNTPIHASMSYQYTVDRTVSLQYSNFTEETITESVSKVTESINTHSYTGGFEVGVKFGIKNVIEIAANTKHSWTNDWGSVVTNSQSKTTSLVSQSSSTYNETITMSESTGFIKGRYYRMAIYETVSVYGVLVYDSETGTFAIRSEEFLTNESPKSVWEESIDGTYIYQQDKVLDFDAEKAIEYVQLNGLIENVREKTGDTVNFMGGSGTADKPYLIGDIEQFSNIRLFPSAVFSIVANIDATGYFLQQIPSFDGTINGNNHTISNLNITKTDFASVVNIGIFETLNGTVSNLKLRDCYFEATPKFANASLDVYCGSLAAINNGNIKDCDIRETTVIGNSNNNAQLFMDKYGQDPRDLVPGGTNFKEWIQQSFNVKTSKWKSTLIYRMYVGGVVGSNNGTIENTTFTGNVESNLYNSAFYRSDSEQVCLTGGIAGINKGTVRDVNVAGSIQAWIEMNNDAGGDGWVSTVSPKGICYACGLVGLNNSGSVSGTSNVSLSARYRVYAPTWDFGAVYGQTNKATTKNLTIGTFPTYGTR